MKVSDTGKGCLGVILFVALYLGWCYFEQAGQHRWAPAVAETMEKVPGARLVSSFKSGDLINPVSWFWPATARMVYARPDLSTAEPRFYIMSFGRDDEEEQPSIWLVAIDCEAGTEAHYFPAEAGDKGELAMTGLGDPVMAPDGTIYRRHETDTSLPPDQLTAFCDTDWTRERQALATGVRQR
jgi:hypothetical protein